MSKFTPIYDKTSNPPVLVNCVDEFGNQVDLQNCLQLGKDECVTCWRDSNKSQCYHKELTYGSAIARASIPAGAQESDLILTMEISDPSVPAVVETIDINLTLEQWTQENLQVIFNDLFGTNRAIVSNVEKVLYLGFNLEWEIGLWNDADVLNLGGWSVTFTAQAPANDYLGQFEGVTTYTGESLRHFRASLWSRCGVDGQPTEFQWRDAYTGELLTEQELSTLSPDCSLEDIGIDVAEDLISIVKNPICFFHDEMYYEGWEIESINTTNLESINRYAIDIDRTINVIDYTITDCTCNNEVPNQPTAVDDSMGESIFGIPVLVPSLTNDIPCALGQTTTWELIPGSENNVSVINNNNGTFQANPLAPGAWDFEYRIFCDGVPTIATAIVSGSTVVFVTATDDPQGNVPTGDPLIVDTTGNDLLCPAPSVTGWAIVLGSESNVTNLVNNNDGTFTFEPGLGAWNFEYEILCDGAPTGETAEVSGVGVYAVDAVNDIVPPQEFGSPILFDVSLNDIPCPGALTTTYVLISGSEVNATVTPAISPDGNFTINPLTEGPYSFDYEIYCDGVASGEVATVNGATSQVLTIVATTGPNGTITPIGSTDYPAGGSALYTMIPDTCLPEPPCVPATVGYGFNDNESKYVVFDPQAGGEGTVINIYDGGGLYSDLDGKGVAYRKATEQLYVFDTNNDVFAIDVTNTTPSAGNPNLVSLGTTSSNMDEKVEAAAFYNDTLYVISRDGTLYTINPDTLVILSSVSLNGLTDPKGMAIHPDGTIYVTDKDIVRVYTVDPVTGNTSACFDTNLGIKGESFSISSDGLYGYVEENGGGTRVIYRFDFPAACGGADVVLSVANTYENYGEDIKGMDFSNDGCPPPCYDYEICQLIVDGVEVPDASNYVFSNIQADHTIHVEFCPVIVEANDDNIPDSVQSGVPQIVDVEENDIICPVGSTTTFVLIPGSEVNVVVGPPTTSNDGTFNYIPQNTGPWSFNYEIYCDGIPTGKIAEVSGTSQAAIANDDFIDPSYVGNLQVVDVKPNDVECAAPNVTTYQLIPATEVNVTVVDNGDGTFDVTPGSEGNWEFYYYILCNGVIADTARVYGSAVDVNVITPIENVGGTITPGDNLVVPEGENRTFKIYPDYCLVDDGAGGLLYGHFDADYNISGIYPIGGGATDRHDHEYDDDNDTTFVDYINNPAGWDNLQDLIDPNQRFKIVISNADINTAGFISINQNFDINDPSTYTLVTDYDDTAVGSLPIYSINGVAGSTQLTELKLGYFPDAIARGPGGIIPTNTGDVRDNVAGLYGEWRNGALTMELVAVDQFGNDLFTLNPALSNGGVQGPAVSGTMLYEATLFWHWDGPCNNENSPSYSDSGWQEAYDEVFTTDCSGGNCTSHEICDVLVDGVSVGPVSSYTFYNVTDNHTIEACFAPIGSCPPGGGCL